MCASRSSMSGSSPVCRTRRRTSCILYSRMPHGVPHIAYRHTGGKAQTPDSSHRLVDRERPGGPPGGAPFGFAQATRAFATAACISAFASLHEAALSVTGMCGSSLAPGAASSGTLMCTRTEFWSEQYWTEARAAARLCLKHAAASTLMACASSRETEGRGRERERQY